jgi:ribosomal-protein-alanine N-acetyltransferase
LGEDAVEGPVPLDLLRAVADPVRLATLGASVAGPVSIDALADGLGVSRKEVAEAIGYLTGRGLLDKSGRLEVEALRAVAGQIPVRRPLSDEPIDGPWTADEADVLSRFFDGDRLLSVPSVAKKKLLVLERIVQSFEPGLRYPERDVNFKLQLIYADYALIRRGLVDEGFMDRADGSYWRIGGRYELPVDSSEALRGHDPIETSDQEVELRPYTNEMVAPLAKLANDVRVSRYMSDRFPYPYTTANAIDWIAVATADEPPMNYAIYVAGTFAGGVGAIPGEAEMTGTYEVGWWLGSEYWGRGVTSTAAKAFVDVLFERRGAMRVWAPVMGRNGASARVAEKAGLALEGVSPSAYLKGGVRHDQLRYGLTRAGWLYRR